MDIFGYYIELPQEILLANNPFSTAWFFIKNGFWLVFLLVFYQGFKEMWTNSRQIKYIKKWQWVLLAINVPKDNEQTPKAVENIFSNLAGSHTHITLWEKYWEGKKLEPYSFEIISIGGYVQFLIRTTVQLRDLVEAAIYAQYPTAEITEVADYVDKVPHNYPNDEYELWGTELVLTNKEAFPIRTYVEFEHQISQETKDPMASILEILSKLNPQEQLWLQIIVTPPANDKWRDESIKVVKKMVGAKVEQQKGKIGKLLQEPTNLLNEANRQIFAVGEEITAKDKANEQFGKIFSMSPGERRVIELIEKKASKIGFETKFRMIYIAPKSIFLKGRGVSAVIGSIKQFNTLDMNGFKPHRLIKTAAKYFFVNRRIAARQRKIIKAYTFRSNWAGSGKGKILNIEELATIWHFPMLTVKAPLVKKVESKRSEPPFTLPTGEMPTEADYQRLAKEEEELKEEISPVVSQPAPPPAAPKKYQPPPNLPIGD